MAYYNCRMLVYFSLFLLFLNLPSFAQTEPKGYVDMVISHLSKRIDSGRDEYGSKATPFWMATLDPYTGKYPENDKRPKEIPNRVYLSRPVDAPKGSTLYWDMASIVTAYNISQMTGDNTFASASDEYIRAFMEHCVAQNGVYLWGNHFYYDAFVDQTLRFGSSGDPEPVNFSSENGSLHEMRPLPGAWEALWRISPESVEKEITTATYNHISNHETGEFNRHAQGSRGHAFLESGGLIVHMLAWLYGKTKDETLAERAHLVARYSFEQQSETTGLLPISPNKERWDKYATSTEVGLWARALLAGAEYMNEARKEAWINMADQAVTSWIKYSFNPDNCQFYGLLAVDTGAPVWREDDYPYKPDDYSSIWEPLFPRHDYPMSMAESCLKLYQITGKPQYKATCQRWYKEIKAKLPARDGRGAYAEHYARVIHFLLGCSETFDDPKYAQLAAQVAQEATTFLYLPEANMFRSHTGEDRFDTVDGVGMLSLSLIWLETGKQPEMMGFFF